MTERCTACSCEITPNKSSAGDHAAGVLHADKWYCLECAGMILPPEELERLSQGVRDTAPVALPASAPAPARASASVLASDDDVLGEEMSPPPESASPAAAGSRAQRAVTAPTNRDSNRKGPSRAPSVAPPSAGSSSSRRGVTTSSRRDSSIPGVRGERADNAPSNRGDGRARKRQADSMGLYIGLGVGAVALVVVLFLVFSSKPPVKAVKPPPKAPAFEDTDKTPSGDYAQKARDFAAKKDSRNAVLYFTKAAERAEKEGNTQQAKEYGMQAVSIEKASTLH